MKKIEQIFSYVFIFAVSLTPILWLGNKSSTLINGLDTNFPLDPVTWLSRRFYTWNNIANAGSENSQSISGIFFHSLQAFFYKLGFSLHYVELFTLIFWFTLIVFSIYLFLRTFITNKPVIILVGVFIYSYNIYLYNTWENIKVSNIALVIALPLFLSLMKLYRDNKIKHLFYIPVLVVVSFITAGAGINPAYFIAFYSALILYALIDSFYEGKNKFRIFKTHIVSLSVILSANFFYLLPLFRNLLLVNPVASVEQIGFTNWIDSLSKNTSLLNIMRLMGAWDWYDVDGAGMPIYIPYALNYFSNPIFIAFSFVLPVIALGSFYFVNKNTNKNYLYLGLLLIIGLFMGAGTHPPTGYLYKFLATVIPFLSFFRSPWYIFTPYVVLSYAALSTLFFNGIFEKYGSINVWRKISCGHLIKLSVLVFLIGHFLYSYPIWTGKIFRPGREDSFYVQLPQYVFDADNWLDSQKEINRIVVYPDDALESYKWGYRGTESILRLFSDKEFISRSFNVPNQGFAIIYEQIYADLKRGYFENAFALMEIAGADTLMIRKDARTFSPDLDIDKLVENAKVNEFGDWIFVQPNKIQNNKFYIGTMPIVYELNYPTTIAKMVSSNSYSIDKNESQLSDDFKKGGIRVFKAVSDENIESESRTYKLTIEKKGNYYILIERNLIQPGNIDIKIEGKDTSETIIDNKFIKIGPYNFDQKEYLINVTYPKQPNLIPSDYYLKSDTFGLSENDLPSKKSILVVSNYEALDKRFDIEIEDFNIFNSYILNFDYKYITGNPPVLDIYQHKGSIPLQVDPINLPKTPVWSPLSLVFSPVDIGSDLKISIRVDAVGPMEKTIAYFDNMRFTRIYDNEVYALEVRNTFQDEKEVYIQWERINPTKYHIKVTNAPKSFVLISTDSYSPDWRLSGAKNTHFMANGYANAWKIDSDSNELELEVIYINQIILRNSIILSIVTISTLWFYPIIKRKKRN